VNPDQITRPEFLFLSPAEITLFYALVWLSLGYAAWQFVGQARAWRTGQPISWPSGPRQWWANVDANVLSQRRVRAARKGNGAPMHLLIFYGFLTLFAGTTLLAVNTYSPVKFHFGAYYLLFEQVMDWMGLSLLAGLIWALGRRLRIKRGASAHAPREAEEGGPIPLSQTPADFAALGLLILVTLTGFLAEGARISAHPEPFDTSSSPVGFLFSLLLPRLSAPEYRAIWWIHSVSVIALFAAFPHLRLRHAVLAVLSTAGSPPTPLGALKSVTLESFEETGRIGAESARDYSRWHLLSLDACMECGRCTEVCPAARAGKSLDPKQVVQGIRGAMRSNSSIASVVDDEALWACTTCNACVEACPVLIRHVDLLVDARRSVVADGRLSGGAVTMLRQTERTGHPWGSPASQREEWMKGLDLPLARDGKPFEILFWVGCLGASDSAAAKTTRAVAHLLKIAGVSFACLGREETCTGDAARRVGDEFLFQTKAAENVATLNRYGVQKVVTTCPHCLNTLRNEYPAFGGSWEVLHHTELLSQLIDEGRLNPAKAEHGEMVFHDPCYLARANGIVDAPRKLVDSPMVEPRHHGVKTLCCGAGGGRMWMDESAAQRPADRRAEELLETGAKTVVVGCPFCRIMLEPAVGTRASLLDIAQILTASNGGE